MNDYDGHPGHLDGAVLSKTRWTVAEAKAKFSQVIDQANTAGPQTIARSGEVATVVVSAEGCARRAQLRALTRSIHDPWT